MAVCDYLSGHLGSLWQFLKQAQQAPRQTYNVTLFKVHNVICYNPERFS